MIDLSPIYAGFAKFKVVNYDAEQPGLGYSIGYDGAEKGQATVYVYDLNLRSIPDGPESEIVRRHFEGAISDVTRNAQSTEESCVLLEKDWTGSPERGKEFLCAEFMLGNGASQRRSVLFLTAVGGKFLKARVTLRTTNMRDQTARHFADELAAGLEIGHGDTAEGNSSPNARPVAH